MLRFRYITKAKTSPRGKDAILIHAMPEDAAMAERIVKIPGQISREKPLIHMIPNSVTVALCTDGLSALGARPLMANAPEEMTEIPAYADAVVVNMGQPTK